jgi:type III pantothenate kinase
MMIKGDKMLLADVGNTYFHIYDGMKVEHLSYEDAIERYAHIPMRYISVKQSLGEK